MDGLDGNTVICRKRVFGLNVYNSSNVKNRIVSGNVGIFRVSTEGHILGETEAVHLCSKIGTGNGPKI